MLTEEFFRRCLFLIFKQACALIIRWELDLIFLQIILDVARKLLDEKTFWNLTNFFADDTFHFSKTIVRKIFIENYYSKHNLQKYFSKHNFWKIFFEKYFPKNIFRKIFFEKYFSKNMFRKTFHFLWTFRT